MRVPLLRADEARHYAETAPVQLIDSAALIRALQRSRKNMLLPQTYKAMCRRRACQATAARAGRKCGSARNASPQSPRNPRPQLQVRGAHDEEAAREMSFSGSVTTGPGARLC
jgi:hypothetical protein